MSNDQGPNMEMRAFIAVVLSLGVMVGYQYLFAPEPLQTGSGGVIEVESLEAVNPPEIQVPEEASGDEGTTSLESPAIVAGDRPRQVTLETERYRMLLDNRGGLITGLELIGFDADFGGPLELVVNEPGFAPVGLLSLMTPETPDAASAPNQALYRMTIDGFEPSSLVRAEKPVKVHWQWADPNGWSVDKQLTVNPDGHLSDLTLSVESPTGTPIFLMLGPGLENHADNGRTGIYLMSGAVLFDGEEVEHLTDVDLETPDVRLTNLTWGGIQSPYFAALFVPEAPMSVYVSSVPASEPIVNQAATEETLEQKGAPGTRAMFGLELQSGTPVSTSLYIGPKDYSLLFAEGHGLERAVDYGVFRILARPVAVTLEKLYEFTGNYGLAIILATFGVRLIFFPLSQKSMKSMRKMQQLQPQMNAIRAKFKGVKDAQKRQEMNVQVMQLYKDNGVSPLGGCLPMLLQMPVLFGFYAAISVSIISRHAPFMLWIQDLSQKDPYYVLPLSMGAAMYGQQRMSPGTGDPMQQRIFRLMPIMFTFFFLSFPSGLVIYWLVNTALGIAQQAYVNHQLGAADAIIRKGPKRKHKKRPKGGVVKRKPRGKR
tara:strand:+ start:1154 stop:2950 length:1797 start_codon:yes stop_codon:yes gene_type:complete